MPLPGIKLGEIGAKLGFNTVNNGFLGFENHRIARDRMLMKNAQVLKVSSSVFLSGRNPLASIYMFDGHYCLMDVTI